MSMTCLKQEKKNRPTDEEVTITRMLDKVLKRSDAVDKESLCILAGQRVRGALIFMLLRLSN
jgi:exosome complex RNA-binding protein Rrp42 (RNase PH superfamily)